jgi:hypothetical protein
MTEPVPSKEYMWCYSVPLSVLDVDRYIDLSSTDQYYFDHPHRRQCIALSFAHQLEPTILCRSLHAAVQRFPKVGSRAVLFEGLHRFHLETEQTKLRLVNVKPEILTNICELWRICSFLCDKQDKGHRPLFQAYLMRCADESRGCVLIAGFEHALGDAASYAMFIAAWSALYKEQRHASAVPTATIDLPPDMFTSSDAGNPGKALPSDRPEPRRYQLTAQLLASFKEEMRRRSGEATLSINDILMAQVRVPAAQISCPPCISPGLMHMLSAPSCRTCPHPVTHTACTVPRTCSPCDVGPSCAVQRSPEDASRPALRARRFFSSTLC